MTKISLLKENPTLTPEKRLTNHLRHHLTYDIYWVFLFSQIFLFNLKNRPIIYLKVDRNDKKKISFRRVKSKTKISYKFIQYMVNCLQKFTKFFKFIILLRWTKEKRKKRFLEFFHFHQIPKKSKSFSNSF